MLVDLRPSHPDLTGKQAQIALEGSQRHPQPKHRSRRNPQPVSNQWTENRNSSGYFKGMREPEMSEIGAIINQVIANPEDEESVNQAKEKALALCGNFAYLIDSKQSTDRLISINSILMIMKQSSCAKKGFTLIELLVVISIIGILATIVIGPMNSFLDGASQDAAKQSLANAFGSADKFAKKKKRKMLWPGKDTIKAPHEFAIYQLKKWETNIDDAGIWFLPNDAQRDILEDEGNEIPDKILTTEGSLDKYKSAFGYNIAVPPAGGRGLKDGSRAPTQLCGPEDSTRVTPSGAKTVLGGCRRTCSFQQWKSRVV